MAAARQKEMNDSITVVATTTLVAPDRCSDVTGGVSSGRVGEGGEYTVSSTEFMQLDLKKS